MRARRVPTLEGGREQGVAQVLDVLRRAVSADLYIVYDAIPDGNAVVTDGLASGDGVVSRFFNRATRQRLDNMWHRNRDPRSAAAPELNTFAAGFDMWSLPEPERQQYVSYRMFTAVGLRWTRRMLAFREDDFAGHVSVCRCLDRPDFDAADLARLARVEATVRRMVVAWHQLGPQGQIEQSTWVLTDATGRVEHATASATPWLDAGGRSAIHDASRRLTSCAAQDSVVVGGLVARVVRLAADAGTRYLWMVEPQSGLRRDPLDGLTPRQRDVARALASGASYADIGETLGMSRETVKTHAARIYAALGVSGRLELAGRLG